MAHTLLYGEKTENPKVNVKDPEQLVVDKASEYLDRVRNGESVQMKW